MSHKIESAVFSEAEGAGWTGLGRVIPADVAKDPAKIAELVGATYTVLSLPLSYDFNGVDIKAPNRVAQVRSDTGELLEVTSESRYHVENRQPIDIFESFRDELAKENLVISHAAVLAGGSKIAVCAKFSESSVEYEGADADPVFPYITGATGYDGKTGTNYFMTTIRTVCDNTLRAGLADSERAGRLIHRTAAQRIEASGYNSLAGLMSAAMDVVTAEGKFYESLMAHKLDDDAAREYFADILGIDTSLIGQRNADGRPVISTRSQNQLDALMASFKRSPGSHLYTASGTLFGAINALTYIIDHEAQIRDTKKDGKRIARITSATFGTGAQTKALAVKKAQELLAA